MKSNEHVAAYPPGRAGADVRSEVPQGNDAEFWDRFAEKYAAQPVADVQAFDRKKTITRAHLHGGARVIEIGCGTGSLALDLAKSAGHIDAFDVSAEMIRIANQKKLAQGVANVAFQHGTLDGDLPFEPEHFDVALAYSILHLVPDRRRVLAALFDLLKPGGALIASNVCLGEGWVPYGPLITVMRWLGRAPRVTVYDRSTLFRELREIGFVHAEEKDVGAKRVVAFVVAHKPR